MEEGIRNYITHKKEPEITETAVMSFDNLAGKNWSIVSFLEEICL